MKKGFGVIELLIVFLLLSIIIAGFMRMTLVMMPDGSLKHSRVEDAQNSANEMIKNIQDIKQKNLEYQRDLLNNN